MTIIDPNVLRLYLDRFYDNKSFVYVLFRRCVCVCLSMDPRKLLLTIELTTIINFLFRLYLLTHMEYN